MSLWGQEIKPMLAFISKPFDDEKFIFELKFDGTRTISYIDTENKSLKLLNRRFNYFEGRYPEFKNIWKDINAKRVILDGEIVVFKNGKPDFSLLASRELTGDRTRIELMSKIYPATYVVFDILHKDGKDLTDLPILERKKILQETVVANKIFLISFHVFGEGKKLFKLAKEKNFEGVMAKRIDSSYQTGRRSNDWKKFKTLRTLDCVIVGYTRGEGWRAKYFGALLCAIFFKRKFHYLGRVGTGLDEQGYSAISDKVRNLETDKNPFGDQPIQEIPSILSKTKWVRPELVAEVEFLHLNRNLKFRAPSFKRLRTDKLPEECTLDENLEEVSFK